MAPLLARAASLARSAWTLRRLVPSARVVVAAAEVVVASTVVVAAVGTSAAVAAVETLAVAEAAAEAVGVSVRRTEGALETSKAPGPLSRVVSRTSSEGTIGSKLATSWLLWALASVALRTRVVGIANDSISRTQRLDLWALHSGLVGSLAMPPNTHCERGTSWPRSLGSSVGF